ncbi:MAG: PAS domain-containing protein [Desulfobacterales bacterium]|nr:PAS domain-containing protein [Desulfobacterales bacterium]
MIKPGFLEIKYKLLIAFLALGIAPFAVMGIIYFVNSSKVLTDRAFDQLKSIREVKKAQMESFFEEYTKDLGLLSETVASLEQSAFNKLNTVQENKRANLREYFEKIFSDIQVISKNTAVIQALADFSSVINKNKQFDTALYDFFDHIKYGQTLSQFKEEYHYYDLMLVNGSGDIVFSLNREKDLGRNLFSEPFEESRLTRCFQKAKSSVNIEDFSAYAPSGGKHLAFAGAPVVEKNGDFAGVVILKIDSRDINRIVHRRLGMGKSGETYILGNIFDTPEYRSDRLIKPAGFGEKSNENPLPRSITNVSGPLIRKADTGEMEIAKYDALGIPGLQWAVVTTMALEEAISPELSAKQDYFSHFSQIYGFKDLYLITVNGDVFYSVTHKEAYNTNLIHGPYANSGLGRVFGMVKETGKFHFVDFSPYAPMDDEPAGFLGLPVFRNGHPHMVIGLRISFDRINAIMGERTGMGKTGESYLVGPDYLMRSDSALDPESYSTRATFKNPGNGRVKTTPVTEVFSGKSGTMITKDYRGTEILSAYTPINAWGKTWALLVEMDKTEALSLLGTIKRISLLVAISSVAVIVFISLLIARHFAKPIGQLTEGAKLVKARNFDISVDVTSNDEMALMGDAFNSMVEEIRSFSRELHDKVWQLESAEVELKRANTLLTAVLEGTTDAIFIKDLTGKYLLANTATCNALGKPLEEIIGKDDTQLFPEASVRVINDADREVLKSGETVHSEERLDTAYGDSYWLSNKSPYLDRDGNIIGLIGISRDITMLKTAQKEKEELTAQLKQAHKMEAIGTLAGGIAHDFNNILGIILGNAELVLRKVPDDEYAHGKVQKMHTASLRAKDVVRQLLSFSRRTEQSQKPMNIGSVINESINLIRSSIPANIEISTQIPKTIDTINADSTQIHQVFINLCTNAYHAMQDTGGILTIILRPVDLKHGEHGMPGGKYVELVVKDTGSGIDPAVCDKIFDPYFTTKEIGKGTGMGLAVVHGIIKSHNGRVFVESQLGKGTGISVIFPAAPRKPQ